MAASFTLTAADFVRLQRIVSRRLQRKSGLSSALFFLRIIFCVCLGLAFAAYAGVLREHPDVADLWTVAYLLLAAILVAAALPHASQALMRKHVLSPEGAFLSPQTLSFTDMAVVIQSAKMRSEVPWTSVLARDEDDANHYLFIDSMQALVLPRSAVASLASEFEQRTSHLPR